MQVKKYEAPTVQEALENVKRDLGPEAIILQTKKHRRGFGLLSKGSVEVTVAVSERSLSKKKRFEEKLTVEKRQALGRLKAEKQAKLYDNYLGTHLKNAVQAIKGKVTGGKAKTRKATSKRITATRYADIRDDVEPKRIDFVEKVNLTPAPVVRTASAPVDRAIQSVSTVSQQRTSLEKEVRELREIVADLRSNDAKWKGVGQVNLFSSAAAQEAFEGMVVNGVDKKLALQLLKDSNLKQDATSEQVMDALAERFVAKTEVMSLLEGIEPKEEGKHSNPVVIALVGPTGVGKTTTLAKIASLASLRRNLRVGLINVDIYKVAAADQLRTYGKILNIPCRNISSREELDIALRDFKHLDVVLVDSSGRSQKDAESLEKMKTLLEGVHNLRTQLVVSATTRDMELYDIGKRFAFFRPEGVIISKLDEAVVYGSIYNLSQRLKLPLIYFTTGQRVPEDIEEATRERLADLVLEL